MGKLYTLGTSPSRRITDAVGPVLNALSNPVDGHIRFGGRSSVGCMSHPQMISQWSFAKSLGSGAIVKTPSVLNTSDVASACYFASSIQGGNSMRDQKLK